MKFTINQNVVFLNEEGGGTVESYSDGFYGVKDQDGFVRNYRESDLGLVHSTSHAVEGLEDYLEEESGNQSVKSRLSAVHSIDLHIEELTDDHSHMSNYDIIQKQMRELRIFVQNAQERKIRKIVVIHGVGEGVLKREVVTFFQGISGCELYDGNYWEYGQGATVVELRYKY